MSNRDLDELWKGTTLTSTPDKEPVREGAGAIAGHSPLRSQLFWILPIALGAFGISFLLWKHQDWGANAAAIISIPINIAAIVVTVLIDRGTFKTGILKKPRSGSRRAKIAVYFTVAALVITGGIWWQEREPNPLDYMSGTVRVGYVDSKYLGWHTQELNGDIGFDADLANAIQKHFQHATLQWVPLGSLDNRIAALRGKWKRPGSDVVQDPVKLVISNFSMTPEREAQIDFVGPYFVDYQGFLSRSDAKSLTGIPVGKVCVVKGSTSQLALAGKGWLPYPEPSIDLCIIDFLTNKVDAVSDDRSILAGYAKTNDGLNPPIKLIFGVEKYGIGMPNNMPRLCNELHEVVGDFLKYEWQKAFDANLAPLGLTGYQVPSLDSCKSAGPWLNW